MEIGECEIYDVVRGIWDIVLGWEIQPTSPMDQWTGNQRFRTGVIQIAGAWEGAVVCICSQDLLLRATEVMFGMPQDALSAELLRDALGELTNMIGGNLKALLPGPSYLCLPTVVEGSDYSVCVPTTRPAVDVTFTSLGLPLAVKILAGIAPPEKAVMHPTGVDDSLSVAEAPQTRSMDPEASLANP